MKVLLLVVLAAGCASTPGPKRPDESHRVPVNRTIPVEVKSAGAIKQDGQEPRRRHREGEVEWR